MGSVDQINVNLGDGKGPIKASRKANQQLPAAAAKTTGGVRSQDAFSGSTANNKVQSLNIEQSKRSTEEQLDCFPKEPDDSDIVNEGLTLANELAANDLSTKTTETKIQPELLASTGLESNSSLNKIAIIPFRHNNFTQFGNKLMF